MAKRVSLFQVLRRELGPVIAVSGFAEVPEGASTRNHLLSYFTNPPSKNGVGFWFQRNVKSNHVDALGSSFTMEFFRSLGDRYNPARRRRSYYLLTPPELEEMRGFQNEVIKRLPPLASAIDPWMIEMFGPSLERERRVVAEPFNPLHEVWMRYRDEQDILSWTRFIGRLLPDLVSRFKAR